jgi:hypothetical protein
MEKKIYLFLVIFLVILNLKIQSQNVTTNKDTAEVKTNIEIIGKVQNIGKNEQINNTDGSNNPEDYGFQKTIINGKVYYIKESPIITILYEPKN